MVVHTCGSHAIGLGAFAVLAGVVDASDFLSLNRSSNLALNRNSNEGGMFWWQQGGWNMRTISPVLMAEKGRSFSDLMSRVTDLCNAGVSVLALQTILDSGTRADGTGSYPQDKMFNGLAIAQLRELNQAIGTWDNFNSLKRKLSDCDMKLVTWLNPSYVWAGAELYTDPANVDMFKWCNNDDNICKNRCSVDAAQQTTDPYPAGGAGTSGDNGCEWVTDNRRTFPDAYFSVWCGQPSGDFAQDSWRKQISDAITFWIGKGIDGFVLDDPTRYAGINADYADPDAQGRFWDAISTPGHDFPAKEGLVPLFGETYLFPELVAGYKLDGGLGTKFGDYENSEPIYNAIDASAGTDRSRMAEPTFQGVDAVHTTCHFRTDGWCAIAWQRMNHRTTDDWISGNPLAQALSAAAGYFTAVENNANNEFWLDTAWPGEGDAALRSFLSSIRSSSAFKHLSMRAPAYSNFVGGDVYSMIRYDAFCTGTVGLFAANLGENDKAELVVANTMSPIVRHRIGAGDHKWMLQKHSFQFQEYASVLPTFRKEGSYLNCYDSSTQQFQYGAGEFKMTLGACLLSCIGDDNSHGKGACKQVTVQWLGGDDKGKVYCWGHQQIASGSCAEECGDKCYSTFTWMDGQRPMPC